MFSSFPFKRHFTLDQALVVTGHLIQFQGITGIEIYGSLIRAGEGGDVDILLIVEDENIYNNFVGKTAEYTAIFGARARVSAVRRIWPDEWADLVSSCKEPIVDFLDVFVMPRNWRDRLDELQGHLPHDDPMFMKNIADDAQCIGTRQDYRSGYADGLVERGLSSEILLYREGWVAGYCKT